MNAKLSPYQPITPELAASALLVTIKQSAADEQACEGTLKANAKARRLRAYQTHFGAPVMVLPSDVAEFLKARPDIASKHHPKSTPAISTAGVQPLVDKPQFRSDSPFPDEEDQYRVIGDFGIGITISSLSNATLSERALVAKTLFEIARAINESIPLDFSDQT